MNMYIIYELNISNFAPPISLNQWRLFLCYLFILFPVEARQISSEIEGNTGCVIDADMIILVGAVWVEMKSSKQLNHEDSI